ncbi:uncharacterized protein LOC141612483 [Silene latifolia]|uniref:uncharacterized protein LOC141612483 n=1 Tax=Silene latifolia TaxID=37657 RepID=UPI003D7734CF
MSEISSARTSSSLALTERKPQIQRTGGCVGIFFQLLDWNRRFAKKKFFPKKLLAPARTKVSKKFNADEKLPVTKHLLIADENSGGFPCKMKKKNGDCVMGFEGKKHEMKAPGLVARLMGLEAMPIAVNKSEKSSLEDDFKGNKGGNFNDGLKNMELSPEKANVRPQKLQKTGVSERRPVTRFGAEALQIRNVLTRSRKSQGNHPKFVSPVKSPKMGRNASRLIDVATRVLEPGIKASNRARCSISYPSSSVMEADEEELMSEVKRRVDFESQFCSNSSGVHVSNVQGGCSSCGNVFGRVDVTPVDYNLGERFFRGLDETRPRPAVYLENENDVVLLKPCRPIESDMIRHSIDPTQHQDQIPVNRIFTSQKNASRSGGFESRAQRSGQMVARDRDRVPPKSKFPNTHSRRVSSPANAIEEPKDFIALNRNIGQSRLRTPSKPDNRFETDRRFQTGKNDSLASQRNPIRRRRTLVTANRQPDSAASGSSSAEKSRSGPQIRTTNVGQSGPKIRPASPRGNKETTRSDVVSFTFKSPVKSSPGRSKSHNEVEFRRRDPMGSVNEESAMEEKGTGHPSRNYLGINEDGLGALLEQKLKELTHQVENEAASGFKPSARTTASILQELISALTMERPVSPDRADSECTDISDSISQANARSKRSSDALSRGIDHFSPGCVLDASFSNESCISSSNDDNSVKLAPAGSDLSDSASSVNLPQRSDIMMVSDLLTHASTMLEDANFVHAKLTPTKRDYMQDIILNTELLFGNAGGIHSSSRFIDFLLGPFLDELEVLVVAAWKNSIILGIEVKKEENPLRRFLLDCLIECLDVKYSRYINSGFGTWSKLPKTMNAEVLIKEFDEEVRKWISFAGMTRDEIIEKEMSISLGKWTNFEIETFEDGLEINQDIVQNLVDEIVNDLCASEINFC